MNRGQLANRISLVIGTDPDVGSEEETLVHELINEAVGDINVRTKLSMQCLEITLVAGSSKYDVPDSILRMDGLYDSEGQLLTQVAPDQIQGPRNFAIVGSDLLVIGGPTDQDRTFEAYFVPQAVPMTNDAESPDDEQFGGIPSEFHRGIVYYGCWHAGDTFDDFSSQQGERYRTWYEGQDGRGGVLKLMRQYANSRVMPAGRRRRPDAKFRQYADANWYI